MGVLRLLARLSLLLSLAAIAQTAPDLDLSVLAGVIRIPVLVTDKQSKPVPNLHVDDFNSRNEDNLVLEELSSATGGAFFPGPSVPAAFAEYPEFLYMLDIPLSAIRADGSSHRVKVLVSPSGYRLRTRENFMAPSPSK